MKLGIRMVCLTAIAFSVSTASPAKGKIEAGESLSAFGENREVYHNPVIAYSAPDPTCIRVADGTYYLYGTEDTRNMPIYKSDDLVHWTFVGTAFTEATRPAFPPEVTDKPASLWAPEIRYVKGKYVLFYSLARWGEEWLSTVGYAIADKPEGPFTPKGYVFSSRDVNVQNSIDQFFWEEDGKYYMLWGSFSGLYIIELNVSDDLTITPKLETKQKIAGNAYEGVNLWKRGGYYYLFASRGSCCEGIRSTYTTVVGRSKNLFGYRAQNETYKEVGCEKRRKALPVKELCVMAASGHAKRNVYMGLHSV